MTTPQRVAPSQEDIIKQAYEIWIAQPTTQQLIVGLKKQREQYIDKATTNALNNGIGDHVLRNELIGAKQMDFVIKVITDYTAFHKLVNQH